MGNISHIWYYYIISYNYNHYEELTLHLHLHHVIVQYLIILSVLSQFLPSLSDVHQSVCDRVDGIELNHYVRSTLVDTLELDGVVIQSQAQVLAEVLLLWRGRW